MPNLLRIDTSARMFGSHTSGIADAAQDAWLVANPSGRVVTRHIGETPVPALTEDTVAGFFTDPSLRNTEQTEAIALSDALIAELFAADMLLLTAPIYNFSVPGTLKCWIDQVTRVGETFGMDANGFHGLLKNKRAVVICAYGADGYLPSGPYAAANFLEPYLQFILRFIGIDDVQVVSVQGTSGPDTSANVSAAIDTARGVMQTMGQTDAA
ncbi:FMN-dependent NADH-azoreductase [Yoonia sp. BS5-3]|uniref:FMN dependent NADH:quinone oxidoreductase n=1 Tax=Yoonia phaeophyticola TaxID=3137369 RepID=A0ABZ3IE21_9RHOB